MNEVAVVMFLSTARTKSFTATANEMYTTKQFVSKSIHALEEELGITLFLRNNHTVTLTEAGSTLLSSLAQGMNQIYHPVPRNTLANRRILTIGSDDWVGTPPGLSAALTLFEQEYNCGIRIIQLGDGKVMALLQSHEVDCVIASRYLAGKLDRLHDIHPLCEQELQMQISPRLPQATSEDWKRLRSVPFLTSFAGENSLTEVYDRIRTLCQKLSYTPDNIEVLPNYASVVSEVMLGNGVTITPKRPPVSQSLQIPLHIYSSLVLAERKNSNDPYVNLLLQFLKETWGGVSR